MKVFGTSSHDLSRGRVVHTWLVARRSNGWSIGAWVTSTTLFVGLTLLLGGPSQADAVQSAYSALLMDHGDWACAYPSAAFSHLANGFSITTASPFYTLVSAAATKLMNIGGAIPFPSSASLGAHCSRAMNLVANWSLATNAVTSMLRVGFVAWLVLLWGVVLFLRSCGRGRDGWEGALLLILASSAPVFACLESFFHPEDLMAMGFILLALANLIRRRILLAGLLLGLALLTQLFAILAIIPIALVLTKRERLSLLIGFCVALITIVGPLAIVTSGRVLHAVAFGTSRAGFDHVKSSGGTVVFSADLHGLALFLVSRAAPIAAAALISGFSIRRCGARIRDPILLVSLVGLCLAVRLVFEVNAFGYYYMASVVSLLLLDVLRGRFSGHTFALIWLVTLAYSPIAWGYSFGQHAAGPFLHALLPFVVSVPVVGVITWGLLQRRVMWYLLIWQVLVAVAFLRVPLPETQYNAVVPSWCWQLLLVTPLLYLLSSPLRDAPRISGGEVPSDHRTAAPVT